MRMCIYIHSIKLTDGFVKNHENFPQRSRFSIPFPFYVQQSLPSDAGACLPDDGGKRLSGAVL